MPSTVNSPTTSSDVNRARRNGIHSTLIHGILENADQSAMHDVIQCYQTAGLLDEEAVWQIFRWSHFGIVGIGTLQPWYIGQYDGVHFYLDFTIEELLPSNNAWPTNEQCRILRDYRGISGPKDNMELVRWGFGVAALYHREPGDEVYPPETDTACLQFSGFYVVMDCLTHNLWLTTEYDDSKVEHANETQDYWIPNRVHGWGRSLPAHPDNGKGKVIGAMRISEDGWQNAPPEDLQHFITFDKFPNFECVLGARSFADSVEYAHAFAESRQKATTEKPTIEEQH